MPPRSPAGPCSSTRGGKLLPWPQADNTGYSYAAHVLSQWSILQDQFQRQRLPYFYCCVDFDRSSFELVPDRNWANSTAYLRGMLEGFVERLYPYTGDARTLAYLQEFVDYEMEHGLDAEGLRLVGSALSVRRSRRRRLPRLESARPRLRRAAPGRRGRLRLRAAV